MPEREHYFVAIGINQVPCLALLLIKTHKFLSSAFVIEWTKKGSDLVVRTYVKIYSYYSENVCLF